MKNNITVIGSRNIRSFNFDAVFEELPQSIITGGAKGIDTLAEQWATTHNIPVHIFKPEYNRYGKAAPLIRNKTIIELADYVLAVWDGKSRGTKFGIEYAGKLGKKIQIVTVAL